MGLQIGASGRAVVVIFDPDLLTFNTAPGLVQTLALANGGQLAYMELGSADQLYVNAESYGILTK
jgi:hypothetical protein